MKRVIDLFSSVILIVILMPVMIVIAILVSIYFKSNPIFTQERVGYNSKRFKLYKFKSMKPMSNIGDGVYSDAQRLTPFGKKLRASSLDELPSFFNVIKGELSLVGPRPLLVEYLPLYNRVQRRRHDVRPGITGWAQINGRNAISWEEKFSLDIWYVDHQSLWLDIKILFLTVKKVFVKEGISAEGHVTIEPFTGTQTKTKDKS